MKVRVLALLLLAAAPYSAIAAAPAATAQALCDSLIASMKLGPSAGIAARSALLAPVVRRAYDLPLMTRLVIGRPWRGMTPKQQADLVDAFSSYCVAEYASEFTSYSGQKFEVDPQATTLSNGDAVVHTRLVTSDPDPVRLDYLVRQSGGEWRIIDVYLNGTISQLAARRSEYSAILRSGGPEALIAALKKKTADLGG
ncbi:MAG TPA: ABC transporter substrate-binding protein [Opitutaceae bacterium]|jgi:phospholipid transport system substrate-binding protein